MQVFQTSVPKYFCTDLPYLHPTSLKYLHPLDEGSDVNVLLAENRMFGQKCAVTLLPKIKQRNPLEFTLSLAANLDSRCSLNYWSLPSFFGVTHRGAQPAIVSDYFKKSFSKSVDELTLHRKISLAKELLASIKYLHRRSIFLGYLSPRKLFLRPKHKKHLILNFILTRELLNDQISSNSLHYVAPEYLLTRKASGPSDLYSLGMTLFFLFTGNAPFRESTHEILKTKQLLATPDALGMSDPQLPAEISRIIKDLTRKEPTDRNLSLDEIEHILDSLDRPLPFPPSPKPKQAPLTGREEEIRTIASRLTHLPTNCALPIVRVIGSTGYGKTTLLKRISLIGALRSIPTIALRHSYKGSVEVLFNTLPPCKRLTSSANNFKSLLLEAVGASKKKSVLLLVVDDLTLASPKWLDTYQLLLGKLKGKILLVASHPTNEVSTKGLSLLVDKSETLTLGALSKDASIAVMSFVLGNHICQSAQHEFLNPLGGNPSLIQAVLGENFEQLNFVYQDGCFLWKGPSLTNKSAGELSSKIRASYGRLPKRHKDILVALSIGSTAIPFKLLAELCTTCSLETLLSDLRKLKHYGVIIRESKYSTIKSAQIINKPIVDFVRSRTASSKIQQLHRQIAFYYETDYQSGEELQSATTSIFHRLQAGTPAKDIPLFSKVVRELRQTGQHSPLSEILETALALEPSVNDWSTVSMMYLKTLHLSGQLERGLEFAKSLSKRGVGGTDRHEILILSGRILALQGKYQEAHRVYAKCLSSSELDYDQTAHVLTHLLSTLCREGNNQEATRIQRQLSHIIPNLPTSRKAEAIHALCEYARFSGDHVASLSLETESAKNAMAAKKHVHALGRIHNLGVIAIESGNYSKARRYVRFLEKTLKTLNHREMRVLPIYLRAHLARREGHHQKALDLINLCLSRKEPSRNRHVHVELLIERAKNFNALLEPYRALLILRQVDKLHKDNPMWASQVEAVLTRAQTFMLLGRPHSARAVLKDLDKSKLSQHRDQYHLCLATLETMSKGGRFDKSLETGLLKIPPVRPYYFSHASLLLAKHYLDSKDITAANFFARRALLASHNPFDRLQLARAHLCMSDYNLYTANPRTAKAHALRSLQLILALRQPLLTSDVYRRLASSSQMEGKNSEAFNFLDKARYILQSRLVLLPKKHHRTFFHQFIKPILSPRHRSRRPDEQNEILSLRNFGNRAWKASNLTELAKELIKTSQQLLPCSSSNISIPSESTPPKIFASFGRELEKWTPSSSMHKGETILVLDQNSNLKILVIPLKWRSRTNGYWAFLLSSKCLKESLIEISLLLADSAAFHIDRLKLDWSERQKRPDPGELPEIIGRHPLLVSSISKVLKIANSDSTVLLYGETGTGKELFARAIHTHSQRSKEAFVPVNCSSFPEFLITSELFGYKKGAFTDARCDKPGLFEVASKGTLFLDEVATMSLRAQTTLLRVLEEKCFWRLGDTASKSVNVRIVAATNQDLRLLVRKGEFRSDLLHRLDVLRVNIPPLRERKSDIPLLAAHFLADLNKKCTISKVLPESSLKGLKNYSFPGNVRELRNILERAFYLTPGARIDTDAIITEILEDEDYNRYCDRAAEIYKRLLDGKNNFWDGVRDPFLRRDLSRREVRKIISYGLADSMGSYRRLTRLFGLQAQDYKRFLNFLGNHDCNIDFRKFR